MTDPQDLADDRQMIRETMRWGMWPFLPMKRKDNSLENKNLGCLYDDGEKGSIKIYHMYLFDPPKTLKGVAFTEYKDVMAMQADGWRVD